MGGTFPVTDAPAKASGTLAYGTDMTLLDVSLRPHAVEWSSGRLQVASLDHALWFHKASDFSQWHLYVQDSPSASGGRGFNRGSIYGPGGALVSMKLNEPSAAGERGLAVNVVHVMGGVRLSVRWT